MNCSNYDLEEEVHTLFEKKFEFKEPSAGAWALPDANKVFIDSPWTVTSLQAEKSRLNWHKSQLNDLRIEEWSQHTRRRHPAGDVLPALRRRVRPEFLTQAWSKLYECACTYGLVPPRAVEAERLVSLHLCEAPGAFVTALNHYLVLHHPSIQWEWTASTLNPYHEGNSPSSMINDDRFVLHTLPRWSFGSDHSGDLLAARAPADIVRRAQQHGEVLLVTADGSVDCLQRPDAQEEVTSPLHYAEVVTALHALAPGGNFLCKVFTMLEQCTVCLLYLLSCVFRRVHVFKPVTSKPGNSEVYVVCLHYAGEQAVAAHLPALRAGLAAPLYRQRALFPRNDIPDSFIEQVLCCAQFFCCLQCNVINSNLEAYLLNNFDCPRVRNLRAIVATRFMQVYNVKPIPRDREILKGLMHERQEVNTNPRHHKGSFTQRRSFQTLSAAEKVACLEREADLCRGPQWTRLAAGAITWQHCPVPPGDVRLELVCGKVLTALRSSKFIFAPVFAQYCKLVDECDVRESDLGASPVSLEDISVKYEENTIEWTLVDLPQVDIRHYASYNTSCLQLITKSLDELSNGGTMFLSNFDILTHTSVGILYVLCAVCFQSVGFTDGSGIVLRGFVASDKVNLLKQILSECEHSSQHHQSVLQVLPVRVTNIGDFFNAVISYNNLVYSNKYVRLLSKFREKVIRNEK